MNPIKVYEKLANKNTSGGAYILYFVFLWLGQIYQGQNTVQEDYANDLAEGETMM